MDIVLLGSGNVATHLGKAVSGFGHRVVQVYSRNKVHAERLADAVNAQAIDDAADVDRAADLYLIAVTDDAIDQVAAQLPVALNGIVVHTAGSVDMTILTHRAQRYG